MNKTILFVGLVLMSTLSVGQSKQAGMPDEVSPDATQTCQSTFTSGSVSTLLKFCVTVDGNITHFESPQNIEFISHGGFAEGYGVCDSTAGKAYLIMQPTTPATGMRRFAHNRGREYLSSENRSHDGGRNVDANPEFLEESGALREDHDDSEEQHRHQPDRFARTLCGCRRTLGATEFTTTFDFTFSAGLGFVRGNFGLQFRTELHQRRMAFVRMSVVRIP
jgi:hypothetical protein